MLPYSWWRWSLILLHHHTTHSTYRTLISYIWCATKENKWDSKKKKKKKIWHRMLHQNHHRQLPPTWTYHLGQEPSLPCWCIPWPCAQPPLPDSISCNLHKGTRSRGSWRLWMLFFQVQCPCEFNKICKHVSSSPGHIWICQVHRQIWYLPEPLYVSPNMLYHD